MRRRHWCNDTHGRHTISKKGFHGKWLSGYIQVSCMEEECGVMGTTTQTLKNRIRSWSDLKGEVRGGQGRVGW